MNKPEKQKSIPASTLKSIDDLSPPSFDMPVEISLKSGQSVKITLQCKALTKTEWAEIRDRSNDEARARAEARAEAAADEEGRKIRIADIVHDTMGADAALVLEFATGWDFADDLTLESLKRLENKCGGAVGAMINRYEVAVYQGRLGN